jgi:hypothetical protein
MLKWKVLEDDKECEECEECEDGRCWRNVLLMQQSSIYSRRSFVGSVWDNPNVYIFSTAYTSYSSACLPQGCRGMLQPYNTCWRISRKSAKVGRLIMEVSRRAERLANQLQGFAPCIIKLN